MAKDKDMKPISGEPIEVDGMYANEWGRIESLNRGDIFPADPMLGTTEWKLVSYKAEQEPAKEGHHDHQPPRAHVDRGDK